MPTTTTVQPIAAPPKPISIAAFTGSETVSSARFRLRQLIPGLSASGVQTTEYIARFGSWPPANPLIRPLWAVASLSQRIPSIINSHRHDLTFLQREFISTYRTLEGLTKSPRILDIDDAVWLHKRGTFFGELAKQCAGVVCGNSYIEEYVQRFNQNTIVLPTLVDTDRFRPLHNNAEHTSATIIGWSGQKASAEELIRISPWLGKIVNPSPMTRLRIVSNEYIELPGVREDRIDFIKWSPENEVSTIQSMSIGLMPISDSEWSKGKCSYKMLLYMACGVPVVVSPFGMNQDILRSAPVGIGVTSDSDWPESIRLLAADVAMRTDMGSRGRELVETTYSLKTGIPKLAAFLRQNALKL